MPIPPLLPEIGDVIAHHLKSPDIHSCVRVSRGWYHIFIAHLWDSVHLKGKQERLPTLATVQAHAHFIRSLILERDNSLQYLSIDYGRLEAFHLKSVLSTVFPKSEVFMVEQLMARIVGTNPTLNTVSLDGCRRIPTTAFWKACLKHDQLQCITLWNVVFDADSSPWCWAALARVKRISITSTQWGPLLASGLDFKQPAPALCPVAQCIEMRECFGVSVRNQWLFIAQCSEAREIHWHPLCRDRVSAGQMSVLDLRQILGPSPWPFLERLNLNRSMLSDESFSVILECSNPLSDFEASNTGFGELAARPLLLRHIPALRHLDLSGCEAMTSPDIQQILTSGARLETFRAHRLQMEELSTLDSKPWICTKIKSLRLHFDIPLEEPRAANELVFARLAGLPNIQTLNLSLARRQERSASLSLRLDMGLSLLADLRDLRDLHVMNASQEIRAEDAEWMAQHWSLTRIYGSLHPQNVEDNFLCKIARRGR